MKKTALCLMIPCMMLLSFYPFQSNALSIAAVPSLVISKQAESIKAKGLLLRLSQINAMDKSNLKSSDKKNLRKEVLSIRDQLSPISGGVYLSFGAIIIILLLLIILF